MLTDPRAIEIISNARQPNVRDPRRIDRDIRHVLHDFFEGHAVDGHAVLELGPGQYDLARLIRDRGADVHIIDRDEAVLELGDYLGFTTINANLQKLGELGLAGRFDGVFCKFSVNAFWFKTPEQVREHVSAIHAVLTEDGWGWIAPWNGLGKDDDMSARSVDEMLEAQTAAFLDCGWTALDVPVAVLPRYGLTGRVRNHMLFVRNLSKPEGLPEA